MNFNYTTLPRMRRVMRYRLRTETGIRRLKAARWLINNCTDAQLMLVFDLTSLGQAAALRSIIENKLIYLTDWETKKAELDAAESLAASVEVE